MISDLIVTSKKSMSANSDSFRNALSRRNLACKSGWLARSAFLSLTSRSGCHWSKRPCVPKRRKTMYNTQDALRWSVCGIPIYEHGTVGHPVLNCQVCSEHHSHVVWAERWHLRLVGREPIACKLQRPNLLCASLGAAELCSSFVKVLWSRNATRSHPRFDPHGMISSPRQLPDESTIPSSVWDN